MSTTTSKVAAGLFLAYATAISAPPVLGLVTSYVTFRQDHEHSFVGRTTTTRCRQHRRQKHHHDRTMTPTTTTSSQLQNNLYDDWSSDLLSSSQSEYSYDDLRLVPTDDMDIEESIVLCLEELMDSEYGKTMFGRHDVPASVGISGSIAFVSLEGPEVILSLTGKFWHRRETVLGKAAMYLNARIPELTSIRVSSPSELADFEDIIDEFTGEILYREDKRSPDFNGDRETMEYQGLDPDARGPFVFAGGGSMIRPA